MQPSLPRILADLPVAPSIAETLQSHVELMPWQSAREPGAEAIAGIYTYGHPTVDGALLERLPGVHVISNFGVGVDHIDVRAATARGVAVGNTPGVLNGATADLAFALLLAAGRRLVEGDRYARGPDFLRFDPSFMLGREVHGSTLGIVGMGRIGEQIAHRARGFGMPILYCNRRRNEAAEIALGVTFTGLDDLLTRSDYVVLAVPLTAETRGMIGRAELSRMKPTATLVNVARGAVVDVDALTEALANRRLYATAVDVTDPEPLPRDHPILKFENLTITPHLGSATEETRQKMAEMSVENLLAGLEGKPLPFQVVPASQK